jgi:hypothetical protein
MLSVARSTYRQIVRRLVNNWLEDMWKGMVVAQFVVLFQCLPGRTKKTTKNLTYQVYDPTFEPPQIQKTKTKHSIGIFVFVFNTMRFDVFKIAVITVRLREIPI